MISVLAGLGVVAGMVTAVGVSGVIAQPLAADPKTEPAQASKAARVAPQRQAELVADEDRRVTRALLKQKLTKPYRAQPDGQMTLVLTARRKPYSWDDLRQLSAENLVPQADGSFLLREHILVGPGRRCRSARAARSSSGCLPGRRVSPRS